MLKLLFLLLFLNSCNSVNVQATQSVAGDVSTSSPATSTPVLPTAITSTITPEPRWVIYEKALADAIIPNSETLCEWEILGTQKWEVYVFAICRDKRLLSAAAVPAVIYLNDQHEIVQVVLPGSGDQYPENIRKLFPPEIQEMILTGKGWKFDTEAAVKHLEMRLLDPTLPPIIAINGTFLP